MEKDMLEVKDTYRDNARAHYLMLWRGLLLQFMSFLVKDGIGILFWWFRGT